MSPCNLNWPPRAGDLESKPDMVTFYLAPRPIPTGVAAFSSNRLDCTANEVYWDFVPTVFSLEFAARCYIGWLMGLILFSAIVGIGIGLDDYFTTGKPVFETAIPFVVSNWLLWIVVTVLGSYYTYSLLKAIYIISKLAPVRFNRQRREVAYMVKRGDTPRIVPWEDVIACVSTSTTITEYGTQNSFALKIGLHAGLEDRLLWLQVPSPTLESAVSEWEAIRVYMEEGPTALPVPFMAGMPEEGTVAYFHACRRNYRERHSYIRYVCGFLLIQFCSGWTLPNHIAEWVERLPRTGFPKAVREWSKPLPPEQWAKPSAELLEESKVVRRSFRKGVDLFQYFKERRTEPPR